MNLLRKKNYDKSKKIFTTVYPKKISLFSKAKGEFVFPDLKEENKLIGNKKRRDSRLYNLIRENTTRCCI